jgi:hypothetical protein
MTEREIEQSKREQEERRKAREAQQGNSGAGL